MLPLGNFPYSFEKCRLPSLSPKLFCNVNWKQLVCSSCPLLILGSPLLHKLCKCLWKKKTTFISECTWHRANFHPPSNCAGDLGDKLTKTTDRLPLTVCKKSPVVVGNLSLLCINLLAKKYYIFHPTWHISSHWSTLSFCFVQILQHKMNNSENVWKDGDNPNGLLHSYLVWYVLADQWGNVCR